MKLQEISQGYKFPYSSKCSCEKCYEILTQDNNFPEYVTYIYLLCECGEYVEFVLPVN